MSTLLECQQLSKSFATKQALKAVTFTLNEGAPIALVGPNGAGKTTLMSIICGFITPTSGSLRVFGAVPGTAAVFGKLGALPQDARLDPRFAVGRQLELFARLQGFARTASKTEAHRVLTSVGLREVYRERPATLSHGMRKRVAIAQALIGAPRLVLLDEPTAGLDPANARGLRALIAELTEQATFIISSHNLDELERLCGSVLYLEQGCLQHQTQLGAIADATIDRRYLTLQMAEKYTGILAALRSLQGVTGVEQTQRLEFLLSYSQRDTAALDQDLLHYLAEKHWHYRQLIKGKTLEEQLFAENTAP